MPSEPTSSGSPASPDSPASHARTVREAGEAGVLARILPRTRAAAAAIVPTGDDAAVVAAPDGRYVVTVDLMVEGPDFRRDWHDPRDLGWKSCASNLADVAAMGARPSAVVVALAVPDDTPVTWLERFGDGFAAGLDAMAPGSGVVGGDLSTSGHIVVSVTAFGDLEGRAPVLRSGARAGDVVALAGHAGRSASGLAALIAGEGDGGGAAAPAGADDDALATVLRAHLAPTPPIAAGVAASLAGATAMMDVSDGLLLDASRLAGASGVAIDLDPAAFAPDVALLRRLGIDDGGALERCLSGGEDHALLATFPSGAALPPPFRRIGAVVGAATGDDPPVRVAGEPRAPRGWDPYARHA